MLQVILLFMALIFLGCSGGGSTADNSNTPLNRNSSLETCVDNDQTISFKISGHPNEAGTSWSSVDKYKGSSIFFKDSSPTLLVERILADSETYQIALIKTDGKEKILATIPKGPNESFFLASAEGFRLKDGTICALFAPGSSETLWFACENGTVENTEVKISGSIYGVESSLMYPVIDADENIHIYTVDSFGSYTMIERRGDGRWREIPKNESSISYSMDAILYDSNPISCYSQYRSSGNNAVIDLSNFHYGFSYYTTDAVNQCKISLVGDDLYLLTEKGYAVLPRSYILDPITAPSKALDLLDLELPSGTQIIALSSLNEKPVGLIQIKENTHEESVAFIDLKQNLRKKIFENFGTYKGDYVKFVEDNKSISLIIPSVDYDWDTRKATQIFNISTKCIKNL